MEYVAIVVIVVLLWHFWGVLAQAGDVSNTLAANKLEVLETQSHLNRGEAEVKLTKKLLKLQEKERLTMKEIRDQLKVGNLEENK
jgi:hypothetical protein